MAKANTVKKAVVRKRRERKNIEGGAVHIQSTFNNTIVTIRYAGKRNFLGFRRRNGLPGLQEIHSFCCTDCRREGC